MFLTQIGVHQGVTMSLGPFVCLLQIATSFTGSTFKDTLCIWSPTAGAKNASSCFLLVKSNDFYDEALKLLCCKVRLWAPRAIQSGIL